MFNRKSISLIAVVTALGVLAVGATNASATRVTPANTAITATLKAETTANFIPENAYSELSVRCTESEANFMTPTEVAPTAGTNNNMNRGPGDPAPSPVGTFSTGPGGVLMVISPKPSFESCALVLQPNIPVANATTTTAGNWSVTAVGFPNEENIGAAAIAVPEKGATINIEGCPVTVSPEHVSAATAVYNNTTKELTVDSQLDFADVEGCSGFITGNPAQFEAVYEVNEGFEIQR